MADKEESKDGGDVGSESSDPPPFVFKIPEEYRKRRTSVYDVLQDEGDLVNIPSRKNFDDNEYDDATQEWSVDHAKLLYMLSKYATAARTPEEEEGWVREIPFLVLAYEGIVAGALDFDYAPLSRLVSQHGKSRRVWLNVSQEGKTALDDLRERGLVNGLKLSTEDFQPVTAFQTSLKGMEMIKQMGPDLLAEVDAFTHLDVQGKSASSIDPQNLLLVSFSAEQGKFELITKEGLHKYSGVSETEDVSYVSSPYLPSSLRSGGKPFTSNEDRRHESASGADTIQDDLSEMVTLKNVYALVVEWIPFGANQIVGLNDRLGSLDRCQGGFFTNMVDQDPTSTNFDMSAGSNTMVKILDYDFVKYINFEAEIDYPAEEGVIQIESFGMHLNIEGTIMYGMKIEAINERLADDICIDQLSRLLVDVHIDSSEMMNNLLSGYQQDLLNMIFMGDMLNRGKYNMIIADEIVPDLPAEEYIDRSEREDELRQVLGEIRTAYKLGNGKDTLLLGSDGCLLAGPSSRTNEEALVWYCKLLSREMFIRCFFVRTFVLDDSIRKIRDLIQRYKENPMHIKTIREKLNAANRNMILLEGVLEYLADSLKDDVKLEPSPETRALLESNPDAKTSWEDLLNSLKLKQMKSDIMIRVFDMRKLVKGASNKLLILQMQTRAITTSLLEGVVKKMDGNTRKLVDASKAEEKSNVSVQVMEIILSGGFAFHIIDRFSGDEILGYNGVSGASVANCAEDALADGTCIYAEFEMGAVNWINEYFRNTFCVVPLGWWLVNILWLSTFILSLRKLMAYLQFKALGALGIRVVYNRKIDVSRLEAYLRKRRIVTRDAVISGNEEKVSVQFSENKHPRWKGSPPVIQIVFERREGFLLTALVQGNSQQTTLDEEAIAGAFELSLCEAGVMEASIDSGGDGESGDGDSDGNVVNDDGAAEAPSSSLNKVHPT